MHKRVHLRPCLSGYFLITVQSILKGFAVLERLIQVLYFLLCSPLAIFRQNAVGVLPLCDDRRTPASLSLSSLSFVQSEAVIYLENGLT